MAHGKENLTARRRLLFSGKMLLGSTAAGSRINLSTGSVGGLPGYLFINKSNLLTVL